MSPPASPGLARHLGRIAMLCSILLAGAFAGALVAALADRAVKPLAAALDRADAVSEPLLAVATLAALFAGVRAALGEGMSRRRRLVALVRQARRWGWLVHLFWIPIILIVIFAEGWVLLIALATPIIVIGSAWLGSALSALALRAGRLTYAGVGVAGLLTGLVA